MEDLFQLNIIEINNKKVVKNRVEDLTWTSEETFRSL